MHAEMFTHQEEILKTGFKLLLSSLNLLSCSSLLPSEIWIDSRQSFCDMHKRGLDNAHTFPSHTTPPSNATNANCDMPHTPD